MLGDFSSPANLAKHPLCQANAITESLIVDTETKRREARPMELETIARACGLPPEFFTAPFSRLAEPGAREDLETLKRHLDAITEQLGQVADDVAASRMTQAVLDAAQETQQLDDESQPGPRTTERTADESDRGG